MRDKMPSLKWTLILLFLQFNVSHPSWTINVPSSVTGLLGSCVVIPCSYDFPDPGKKLVKFTGMWRNDANQRIVHTAGSDVLPQYLNRTKLIGNLSQKNCSLQIDTLEESDHGPFAFRIEIPAYNNFSYNNGKVLITILSNPDNIQMILNETETGVQTASCSVLHSCPTHPPVLKWNHAGQTQLQSQTQEDCQYRVTSTLTFHLTRTDHNKTLKCSVQYHGGQRQRASKVLQVKYAPENVEVKYQPTVTEGETVRMTCSSDANPPVSCYEWYDDKGVRVHTGQEFVLQNVSRHHSALHCIANNTEGRSKSSPVHLNVLYAPDFHANSSCLFEVAITRMRCECIVDSNPPSTVRFVLADGVVPSTALQVRGSITTGTLEANLPLHTALIACLANNTQGATSHDIQIDHTMLVLIIAIGAGVLFILLLILGAFINWRRRAGDTSVPHLRQDDVDLAGVEKNCPNNKLYSKAFACDEHVYGNVQSNGNEPEYANIFY